VYTTRASSSVVIEEIPLWCSSSLPAPWSKVPSPSPSHTDASPNSFLLDQIKIMLADQRVYFDNGLKVITDRVTALEQEMSRGHAEIQKNTDDLRHLFQIGGQALDHTITSIGEVMN